MPRFKRGDVVYLDNSFVDPGFYQVDYAHAKTIAVGLQPDKVRCWVPEAALVQMQTEFWQNYAPSFLWFANDNARSDPKWEAIERDEVIQCTSLDVVRRMESKARAQGIAVYGMPGCDWKLVRSDLDDSIFEPTPEQGKVL